MTAAPGVDGVELLPCDGSALLYAPFIDPDHAAELHRALLDEVPWSQHRIRLFGRMVDEPRLAAWIGDEGAAYTYSGLTLEPHPWTPATTALRVRCEEVAATRFNSVLVNRYRTGRDSMGWHSDDEPELGPEPVIASVSLGAVRRFDLRHRSTGDTVRTEPPSGSVIVMSGACQHHWKHQVPRTARPVGERVNLTFRWIGPRPTR